MIQRVFDNGLTAVVAVDRKAPVAISNLWFAVGSNHEWDGVYGWAHGIEHMMFKGTPSLAPGDIPRRVKQAGGTLNAGTGHETTNYHIVVPASNLGVAVGIHADVVRNASFDPGELDREREVLVEENRMRRDRHSGGGHTWDALMELAFVEAPYRRSIGGPDESLRGARRDEILRFRDRWYVPGNALAVVAGDVDPDGVFAMLEDAFGAWRGTARPAREPLREPAQHEFRYRRSAGDVGRAYLKMGWHVPGELHPDTPALKVLREILAGGRSSRLFREVREVRGLVSEIAMFEETGRDLGILVVDAVTGTDSLAAAEAAILAELDRLASTPPSPAEVERAIVTIERDSAAAHETVQGRAANLGWHWTLGDIGAAATCVERVRGVSAAAVSEVAGRYLGLDRCSMNVFHPRADQAAIGDRDDVHAALRKVRTAAGSPGARGTDTLAASSARREELANGITLVTRRIAGATLVAMGAFVRAGTAHEPPERNGVTLLAQRLMLKGAGHRTAADIAADVESLGGALAPSVSSDAAGLFLSVLQRNATRAWELLASLITSPSFPEDEMERERRQLLQEIEAVNDNSMRRTALEFARAVFGPHPYGLPSTGTPGTVTALGREDLVGWYRRAWTPANMVISIVGDIDMDDMRRRACALGPLPAGPRMPGTPPAPLRLAGPSRLELERDVNQTVIFTGFPGPSALSRDRYAMEVLQAILSGMGNRLFVSLRDRQSLCYFTGFSFRAMKSGGLLAAYIGTSPGKTAVAIDGLVAELRRAVEEEATEEEIERARNTIIGNFALAQQTVADLASLHAGCELSGQGSDWAERYPERIAAVTREELRDAARRWIDPDNRVLVLTRPAGGREASSS